MSITIEWLLWYGIIIIALIFGINLFLSGMKNLKQLRKNDKRLVDITQIKRKTKENLIYSIITLIFIFLSLPLMFFWIFLISRSGSISLDAFLFISAMILIILGLPFNFLTKFIYNKSKLNQPIK